MDKNTVIAIVLSTVVIIGGFSLQSILFPPDNPQKSLQTEIITENAEKTVILNSSGLSSQKKESENISLFTETGNQPNLKEEISVIETPLVRVEFTNRGGDILSYKLKAHKENNESVEMADYTSNENRAFSLILGDSQGSVIDEIFSVKKLSDTAIGFFHNFTVQKQDGTESSFTLVKEYTFLPDDYMFELKVHIEGDSNFTGLAFGQSAYTIKTSPQIGPKWSGKKDQYEYRRFFHLIDGKKKKVELKPNEEKLVTDSISWGAVAGKYFTLIALPENTISSIRYSTKAMQNESSVDQMFLTRGSFSANSSTDTWHFYVGPRTEKDLTKYNIVTNNPYKLNDTKIDLVVESSGILGPLEVVLKWLMEFFYKIIPNWGVSIIILTILMRIILFPLTKKSSESTLKMQELQPKIQEIQTKYKDNTQKMNEEMAKFYKAANYNPLSGCLPILIQFPLIFAMYNLFNNYFEFRGALFIQGWIPDLSKGDSIMKLAFNIPFFNYQLTDLRLLPVIYVVSQLLYGKVTQTPGSAQQNSSMKFMMYGMPLIFFFIFYDAPSGLLIYWTFSNLLTLLQQVGINKYMHSKKQHDLKLIKK